MKFVKILVRRYDVDDPNPPHNCGMGTIIRANPGLIENAYSVSDIQRINFMDRDIQGKNRIDNLFTSSPNPYFLKALTSSMITRAEVTAFSSPLATFSRILAQAPLYSRSAIFA